MVSRSHEPITISRLVSNSAGALSTCPDTTTILADYLTLSSVQYIQEPTYHANMYNSFSRFLFSSFVTFSLLDRQIQIFSFLSGKLSQKYVPWKSFLSVRESWWIHECSERKYRSTTSTPSLISCAVGVLIDDASTPPQISWRERLGIPAIKVFVFHVLHDQFITHANAGRSHSGTSVANYCHTFPPSQSVFRRQTTFFAGVVISGVTKIETNEIKHKIKQNKNLVHELDSSMSI